MRISPREIEVTDIFENQGHKLKFSEEKWGGGESRDTVPLSINMFSFLFIQINPPSDHVALMLKHSY